MTALAPRRRPSSDEIRRIRLHHEPFDPQKVLTVAETALKAHADMRAVGDYKPAINTGGLQGGIVGSSP